MDGLILRAPVTDAIPPDVAKHAAEVDCTGSFPWNSLNALHAEGLLA